MVSSLLRLPSSTKEIVKLLISKLSQHHHFSFHVCAQEPSDSVAGVIGLSSPQIDASRWDLLNSGLDAGKGIGSRIAIIDSGIFLSHDSFKDKGIPQNADGVNAPENRYCESPSECSENPAEDDDVA